MLTFDGMRPLLFTVDYSIETVVRLQIGVKNKIAAYIYESKGKCATGAVLWPELSKEEIYPV